MQSTQMRVSKKRIAFSDFFSAFLEFRLNFEHFEKKYDPHSLCIFEIRDCQRFG